MRAQVIKNRLGPPMRHADFELYFETGIDDDGSWLKVMKEHKLVKSGGAWYTMDDHNGNEIKFQSKDWSEYLLDEEFKSHCFSGPPKSQVGSAMSKCIAEEKLEAANYWGFQLLLSGVSNGLWNKLLTISLKQINT